MAMAVPHVRLLDANGMRRLVPVGQYDDPDWQALLKVHSDRTWREPVLCACTTPAPKIAVRTGSLERRFLAIYPETGHEHDVDCIFWRPNVEHSGRKGYERRVIAQDGDTIAVSLRRGFTPATRQESDACQQYRPAVGIGRPRRRQPVMTALGLLHLIWEESRLNIWKPHYNEDHWWAAVTTMRRTTMKIFVRQRARAPAALYEYSYIAPPRPGPYDSDAFNRVCRPLWNQPGSRLVVAGAVLGFRDQPCAVRVAGVSRLYLNLTRDDYERLSLRFARLQAMSDHVVGLFMLETDLPAPDGVLRTRVLDAGMMACTKGLIPVESRYEHEVAERLVLEGRRFIKPLRFDAAADAVLPDFVLLDAGEPYPMEVYGMDTPTYRARREVKDAYYAEHFGGRYWTWDAVDGVAMPSLPPKKR